MAGMSVDGLVSGLDTTNLINQLVAAEGASQTALKTRLKATENAASGYRTVNTTFLAITAAAEAALKPDAWTPTKASSSSSSVAATATTGAPTGSLTFTVVGVASSHGVLNRGTTAWTAPSADYGASSIEVRDAGGAVKGSIAVGGSQTLADAAAAINADKTFGLSAAVVQVSDGATPEYVLQVTSKKTGADSRFSLGGAGTFETTALGANAELKIGGQGGASSYSVYSSTNVFDKVMPGTTITVAKVETSPVTVSVASDPDAVASKVQTMVDAVNAAIRTVKDYTNNTKGSTAALGGDFSVSQLAGRLLDAVSSAVGASGSPAQAGFSLTREGTVTFKKDTFLTALKDDPELASALVLGTPESTRADGTVIKAVPGIAARLLEVSKSASDATTGSLVSLAKGQDANAKDIQARIEAWDLRLEKRRETLTRQFTAMETALNSLKNQSTWLAGQLSAMG
ncbi:MULTISPECIES: flagellar filament capping protein FliD [unclassified Blastococcus]